jgi:predicted nucleic acid-binding Zn ribbon protein
MGEFSMQDALKNFLNQSRLKGDVQALQIEEIWEKLMGKTISKYTDSIKIIHQTLFITTSVAPLKNELLFQKDNIIKRVNEALGENIIREVIIK